MWLDRQLLSSGEGELPFYGRVTAIKGSKVEISAGMQLGEVVCIGGLPAVGDEVLVLPVREGYACIGKVVL